MGDRAGGAGGRATPAQLFLRQILALPQKVVLQSWAALLMQAVMEKRCKACRETRRITPEQEEALGQGSQVASKEAQLANRRETEGKQKKEKPKSLTVVQKTCQNRILR